MLFAPKRRCQPGPKGPKKELIDAIVEMKRRNPNWGCPRMAQQLTLAFGVEIDKDVVRRILATHYRPQRDPEGPSWLTFNWQYEGQSLEPRPFPLRVRDPADALGADRHGSRDRCRC